MMTDAEREAIQKMLRAQLVAVGKELTAARVSNAHLESVNSALHDQLVAVGKELAAARVSNAHLESVNSALHDQLVAVGKELAAARGPEAESLAWLSKARTAVVDRNVRFAEDAYVAALRLRPSADVWCEYGDSLFRQSRYEEARRAYEEALFFDPTSFGSYRLLGEAFARQRKLEEAASAHSRWFHTWIASTLSDDVRRRADAAIAAGTQSIVIVAMPKSASEFIMTTLAAAYNVPFIYPSVGSIPRDRALEPSWRFVGRGGVLVRTHMDGDHANRIVMRAAGIRRFVVHVRDPRQATLSWIHMMARLSDDEFQYGHGMYDPVPPGDFRIWDFPKQLSWALEHYFPGQVYWLTSWLDDDGRPREGPNEEILLSTYDMLRSNPMEFLSSIVEFFGAPTPARSLRETVPTEAYRNMRLGDSDEWRYVLSSTQKQQCWFLMPKGIASRFQWIGY